MRAGCVPLMGAREASAGCLEAVYGAQQDEKRGVDRSVLRRQRLAQRPALCALRLHLLSQHAVPHQPAPLQSAPLITELSAEGFRRLHTHCQSSHTAKVHLIQHTDVCVSRPHGRRELLGSPRDDALFLAARHLRSRAFFTKLKMAAWEMECASRPMLLSSVCTWASTAAASASAFLLYVRCSCRYMSVVDVMSGIVPCTPWSLLSSFLACLCHCKSALALSADQNNDSIQSSSRHRLLRRITSGQIGVLL